MQRLTSTPFITTTALACLMSLVRPSIAAPAVDGPGVAERTDFAGPSAWGILPWNGLGLGGRYLLPLSIDPLLSGQIRDRFAVEFGADLLHLSYGYFGYEYKWTQILPVAGVMWNLWLSPRLAAYPKLELGYAQGWLSGWDSQWSSRHHPSHGGLFVNGTIGILYHMQNRLTFRAEAGYAGLKLGVGWLF